MRALWIVEECVNRRWRPVDDINFPTRAAAGVELDIREMDDPGGRYRLVKYVPEREGKARAD